MSNAASHSLPAYVVARLALRGYDVTVSLKDGGAAGVYDARVKPEGTEIILATGRDVPRGAGEDESDHYDLSSYTVDNKRVMNVTVRHGRHTGEKAARAMRADIADATRTPVVAV